MLSGITFWGLLLSHNRQAKGLRSLQSTRAIQADFHDSRDTTGREHHPMWIMPHRSFGPLHGGHFPWTG